MDAKETIAVLDFGSQTAQLIARRIREQNVHSELLRPDIPAADLKARGVSGIVLSGGPASVYVQGAPDCDAGIFDLGVPVLGICYGMQIGVQKLGGVVEPTPSREFGRTKLTMLEAEGLLAHLPDESTVWMSHGDQVQRVGPDFVPLATTGTCPVAAVRHRSRPFYGVQFHPEVTHTAFGTQILRNFVYDVCGCTGAWQMGSFIEQQVESIRARVGDAKVICGLSGGVDSAVVAALIHRAIGDQLVCIFVDNGLLRKNEAELVEATFRGHFHLDLRVARAGERFLGRLKGVTDPQEKRRIIGHEFIEAFNAEAKTIANAKFLAQGTLYPDVIESGASVGGKADVIKGHHNVWGLPADMKFELIEPLRDLFKDEVRIVGEHLGLPEEIVWRHPFPGPGLAVRILGEITEPRLAMLRDADEIVIEEIRAGNLYRSIAQAFAVLLPISSVGVMGDGRSYDYTIAVRAVETRDFMTADWVRMPYEVLAVIANRIINEVRGVNRVVYDLSSKPPATIEWE
ncbi:MAG: GMP synthase [glutamine-hydrolyzing] [Phycisphaerae bacterium]|nr:GMP synthase [glutamine-hydrolyzing] [Phycisphaerae bacterium]